MGLYRYYTGIIPVPVYRVSPIFTQFDSWRRSGWRALPLKSSTWSRIPGARPRVVPQFDPGKPGQTWPNMVKSLRPFRWRWSARRSKMIQTVSSLQLNHWGSSAFWVATPMESHGTHCRSLIPSGCLSYVYTSMFTVQIKETCCCYWGCIKLMLLSPSRATGMQEAAVRVSVKEHARQQNTSNIIKPLRTRSLVKDCQNFMLQRLLLHSRSRQCAKPNVHQRPRDWCRGLSCISVLLHLPAPCVFWEVWFKHCKGRLIQYLP